jgi:hypothetical protein
MKDGMRHSGRVEVEGGYPPCVTFGWVKVGELEVEF